MALSDELPPYHQKPLPLTGRQPFYTIWAIANILSLFVRVPFWAVFYVPRDNRQNPNWTWRNAFVSNIARHNFWLSTTLRLEKTASAPSTSAVGGKDLSDRVEPVEQRLLQGVLSPSSTSVRPEARPGAWYPSRYHATQDKGKKVLLYFFGGSYVAGTHTPDMYKGTLDTLLPTLGNAKFFGLGYRHASTKGNHFPAQLLDALSGYQHLLSKGIAASDIILVGDSAGGNLVLALLRYITEVPELNIPLPGAAIAASPWVDLSEPMEKVKRHPMYHKDALPTEILEWGVTALVPSNMSLTNRYISPGLHPFKLPIPLHLGTDDGEIFLEAIVKFGEGMKAIQGNRINLYVNKGGCHGLYMIASLPGFENAMIRETESIRSFFAAHNVI